jgi:putative endonuclease
MDATGGTRAAGAAVERRASLHYRLRGFRILERNAWVGGYELDLIVRRGRRLVFCEVKAKSTDRFGDPLAMVGPEKQRRLRQAAETWLAVHPEVGDLEPTFEVVALRDGRLERLENAF